MLLPRIVSAVILAPLFLALVYAGSWWFDLLIAATATLMAHEFAGMDGERGLKRRFLIATGSLAAIIVMAAVGGPAGLAVMVVASIAVILADRHAGQRGLALIYAAVPYVALPAMTLVYLRGLDPDGPTRGLTVFWLVAVVWGTDIGAYACGRLIGGPKLAPTISPKKTWSGAIGGLVCGVGASAAVLAGFSAPVGAATILAALVAAATAEAGDLLESAVKRWYDVKDSGTLIPGHGGLMDRFDGLWAAAPVAALVCRILGGGVNQW